MKREKGLLAFIGSIEFSSTSVASEMTSGSLDLFLLIFNTNRTAKMLIIIISKYIKKYAI